MPTVAGSNLVNQKQVARKMVADAIRTKRLVRGACEVCGIEKAQAHHPDYSKPLDIQWLCRRHHGEAHGWKMSDRSEIETAILSGTESYAAIAERSGISRERVRQIATLIGAIGRPKVYARRGGQFARVSPR